MGTEEHYEVESRGLFGQTRSALLAMLYGHADQSFYLRQLVKAVGAGHGALQRELKRLTEMGLIVRTVQGNQVLDLMVLGDAPFSEVVSALSPAQKALGRGINPTVFPVSEFR